MFGVLQGKGLHGLRRSDRDRIWPAGRRKRRSLARSITGQPSGDASGGFLIEHQGELVEKTPFALSRCSMSTRPKSFALSVSGRPEDDGNSP